MAMVSSPNAILTGIVDKMIITLFLIIGGLSAAGGPAYFFDDVLDLQEFTAWAYAAIVWFIAALFFAGGEVEAMASVIIYELYGWNIENPLLLTGMALTILHVLVAVSVVFEESEETGGRHT